ncbi:MAG: sterol desaturase family protein, partial [Blastomonas sp.]|nr:sterol desaturase family protein [Blastomonas sp.]
SHHQHHHARYTCNYGLYFRFWDRLCGTDKGLGEFPATGSQRVQAGPVIDAARSAHSGS